MLNISSNNNNISFNAQLRFTKEPKKYQGIIQDVSRDFSEKTKRFPNHTLVIDTKTQQVSVTKTQKDKVKNEATFNFKDEDGLLVWMSNHTTKWVNSIFKTMLEKTSYEKKINKIANNYAEQVEKRGADVPMDDFMVDLEKLDSMKSLIKDAGFKRVSNS